VDYIPIHDHSVRAIRWAIETLVSLGYRASSYHR